MQQLTFIRRGKIEWQEVPEPKLQGGKDAIVRPLVAGRCDLDYAIMLGITPMKGPFALGHEMMGEIVSVGNQVQQFKVGQRVVVPASISCGHCSKCQNHLTACCQTYNNAVYGVAPDYGGGYGSTLSDLVRIPEADAMLVAVPDNVSNENAFTLGDNGSDAYRTVGPYLEQGANKSVFIVGGLIHGLYALAIAKVLGCHQIRYMDTDESRLATAKQAGAEVIEAPIGSEIREKYDICVDASAQPAGFAHAIRSVAPGGVCSTTSIFFSNEVPIPFAEMFFTDVTLKVGVAHSRPITDKVMHLLEHRGLDFQQFTTMTLPWADLAEGYRARTTKLVVTR